jgi:hypothetical protein
MIGVGSPLHVAKGQYFPVLKRQFFVGTPLDDSPRSILQDPSGDLVLSAVSTDSTGMTDGHVFRVKTDGKLVWKISMGGNGNDELTGLVSLPSENIYVCTGSSASFAKEQGLADRRYNTDYWATGIATSGQQKWRAAYGGANSDMSFSACKLNEQLVAMTGTTWSSTGDVKCSPNSLNNMWTIAINPKGLLQSSICFGGRKNEWGKAIAAGLNETIITTGITTSDDLGENETRNNGDVWIRKYKTTGELIWQQILTEHYEDNINAIVSNPYDIVYAVGSSYVKDKEKQFWIIKLDPTGKILFNKKFGDAGVEELTAVANCSDGGIIVTGYSYYRNLTSPYIKGQQDLWVIRLDASGNIIWQQTYGGPHHEKGVAILEYSKGLYYVLGKKENRFQDKKTTQKYDTDAWILCIEELPCAAAQTRFAVNVHTEQVKVGSPVRLVNQTKYGEKYTWQFGDGTESAENQPSKVYSSAGNFLIKLISYNNLNCMDIYVHDKPVIVTGQ